MSLKHGLLGFLLDSDHTGYELMKFFGDSLRFFWSAQTSQIYRDLNGMEKSGLLTSELIEQSGKPNKKNYSITEAGRKDFYSWLNDYDFNQAPQYRESMLMKIFFSSKGDKAGLVKGLVSYIDHNKQGLKEYEKIQDIIDGYASVDVNTGKSRVYWEITHLRGVMHLKSNVEWAEEAIKLLEKEEK
jgi:DNA-binding PadR family transcriptional regulator